MVFPPTNNSTRFRRVRFGGWLGMAFGARAERRLGCSPVGNDHDSETTRVACVGSVSVKYPPFPECESGFGHLVTHDATTNPRAFPVLFHAGMPFGERRKQGVGAAPKKSTYGFSVGSTRNACHTCSCIPGFLRRSMEWGIHVTENTSSPMRATSKSLRGRPGAIESAQIALYTYQSHMVGKSESIVRTEPR